MIRVYISGKITGLPYAEVERKFQAAEMRLKARGYDPVNPLSLAHNHARTWEAYMLNDISALMSCDAIYLLPDWMDSKGARIECFIAREMGKRVLIEGSRPLKRVPVQCFQQTIATIFP